MGYCSSARDALPAPTWAGKAINATISFGMGRTNRADDAPTDHPLFSSDAWSLLPAEANVNGLRQKARAQLGTVGGGNHYVDVFFDETGAIWVGVHFGSRGLGHTIASGFLSLSQGKPFNPYGMKAKKQSPHVDAVSAVVKPPTR